MPAPPRLVVRAAKPRLYLAISPHISLYLACLVWWCGRRPSVRTWAGACAARGCLYAAVRQSWVRDCLHRLSVSELPGVRLAALHPLRPASARALCALPVSRLAPRPPSLLRCKAPPCEACFCSSSRSIFCSMPPSSCSLSSTRSTTASHPERCAPAAGWKAGALAGLESLHYVLKACEPNPEPDLIRPSTTWT